MKSKSVVFRQGDPSEDLYLILDGSVSVIVDDSEAPDQEMVVSYLNPGEFFSEMGLFGEESRTANLVTRTACEFAKISYHDFHIIRQRFPDVLYALTTQIGQRLKNTTRKLADLTFIDVYGRIHRSLIQLTTLPEGHDAPGRHANSSDPPGVRKARWLLARNGGASTENTRRRRLHYGRRKDHCRSARTDGREQTRLSLGVRHHSRKCLTRRRLSHKRLANQERRDRVLEHHSHITGAMKTALRDHCDVLRHMT